MGFDLIKFYDFLYMFANIFDCILVNLLPGVENYFNILKICIILELSMVIFIIMFPKTFKQKKISS